MGEQWRTGTKVGRTIYVVTPEHPDGVLVGLVDTPELARFVVDAVNEHLIATDRGRDREGVGERG